MSDKFYAVQFRSTHTAGHHIAVFSLEAKAAEFFMLINYAENLPDKFEFEYEPSNFVGMYEIDYRNPAGEAEGVALVYVNHHDNLEPYNTIPDVYNY